MDESLKAHGQPAVAVNRTRSEEIVTPSIVIPVKKKYIPIDTDDMSEVSESDIPSPDWSPGVYCFVGYFSYIICIYQP